MDVYEEIRLKLSVLDQTSVFAPLLTIRTYPMSPKVRALAEEIAREVNEALPRLDEIESQDELDQLAKKIVRFRWMTRRATPPYPYIPGGAASLVQDRMEALEPRAYRQPLTMSETETVNGYALYDTKEPIMYYNEFKRLSALMQDSTPMTLDEFMEKYDETSCKDWGMMDEHGECFGGYWDYPEGSLVRQNALWLTMNRNGRLLYKLPYSKQFLIASIDYGCERRLECVRYSNFLGEWIRRKMMQLAGDKKR
jgi:hypothetical protein